MRRGWIFFLLAAVASAQEFSKAALDQAIREMRWGQPEAIIRIGSWGPQAARAIPALVRAWEFEAPEMRSAVDEALRAMGPAAFPEIVEALGHENKVTRKHAEEFLLALMRSSPASLDPTVERALLDLLDHPNEGLRTTGATLLAAGGGTMVPKLTPLLSNSSPRCRSAAVLALSGIEPTEGTLAALVIATADKEESVRIQALLGVSRVRTPNDTVVRCLISALGDRSLDIVSLAIAELASRGPAVVPSVVDAWGVDAAGPWATEVLVRLGDPAVGPATEALRSGDARRKRHAAAYLGRIVATRDAPVDGALVAALKDTDVEVRLEAAVALGIATTPVAARAIDALLAATKDADPRVRAAALAAASRAAPQEPRIAPLLNAAKQDADPAMKYAAAAAAARTADECAAVIKSAAAPAAARLLAMERARALEARQAVSVEAYGQVVGDRAVPPEVRAAAAEAITAMAVRRLFALRYEPREDAATKGFRAAADNAIAWLAVAQSSRARGGDGRWKCDGASPENYDVGVTGLALLTFMAGGHTDRAPSPHAKTVREGIEWLVSRQRPEGQIREGLLSTDHTLLSHGIATHALCEFVAMTGDTTLRPQAQKAVDYCVASRSDYGWEYAPKNGRNNTNVTTWMVSALWLAKEVGFGVDPEALEGPYEWIDKMTEPQFGITGYNYPGGPSTRPNGYHDRFPADKTRSMTACGIWCRVLLGEDPRSSPMIKKGSAVCLEAPPKWDTDGSLDMYYWYYGSLAMFQAGDRAWAQWAKPLRATLLPNQEGGGTWKPVDVWSIHGGSIYATTMCTLALLTPWRYPRSLGNPPGYGTVIAGLKEAASSPCERLRRAAQAALPRSAEVK